MNENAQAIYDARQLGKGKMLTLGLQHMFAMFGATILVPILIGIILWDRLPDMIPTHFDLKGEADQYSSKTFTVFFMPLIKAFPFCLY